jgi:hypothetical protein
MLTGTQVATGGYVTESGELLCEQCFEWGGTYARSISNYELDEWQSSNAYGTACAMDEDGDTEWIDQDDEVDAGVVVYDECEPALYDDAGHELRDEYHYHPEPAS